MQSRNEGFAVSTKSKQSVQQKGRSQSLAQKQKNYFDSSLRTNNSIKKNNPLLSWADQHQLSFDFGRKLSVQPGK